MDIQKLKVLAGLTITDGPDRSVFTDKGIVKVNDTADRLDEALNNILQNLTSISTSLSNIGIEASNRLNESNDIRHKTIKETARRVERLIDDAKSIIATRNSTKI